MVVPVMLFSVIAHEYAHGYAALKQGDTTALSLGRLTWNPIKHIHPVLTILLPIALAVMHQPIIGGAKPVPVNPRNYRNFKRGDIIVSAAGIVTNLALALLLLGISVAIGLVGASGISSLVLLPLHWMTLTGIWMKLLMASFHPIPVP